MQKKTILSYPLSYPLSYVSYSLSRLLYSLLFGLLLASCGQSSEQNPTISQLQATLSAPPPTLMSLTPGQSIEPTQLPPPLDRPTQTTDSGWQNDGPELELRHLRITLADGSYAPLVIVRLNPAAFSMRVAYDPDKPRLLRNWVVTTQPILAFNAGYFLENYQPVGLIVSDSRSFGESYAGFGGMLALSSDGSLSLRALRDQPYDPSENFEQAFQSFPMLVFPGAASADFDDNGQKARRTVLAFDQSGRLLIIIAPGSDFSLRELADWLLASDLNIERALNLDGGPSTGLFLHSGQLSEQIDSLSVLPIVVLLNRR